MLFNAILSARARTRELQEQRVGRGREGKGREGKGREGRVGTIPSMGLGRFHHCDIIRAGNGTYLGQSEG